MIFIWGEKIDSILSSGISLENIGVKNWALERDAALRAIKELEDVGVAILGGDVFEQREGAARQTYDNWYCEQKAGESELDFLKRSCRNAEIYVSTWPKADALFAIVPNAR